MPHISTVVSLRFRAATGRRAADPEAVPLNAWESELARSIASSRVVEVGELAVAGAVGVLLVEAGHQEMNRARTLQSSLGSACTPQLLTHTLHRQ